MSVQENIINSFSKCCSPDGYGAQYYTLKKKYSITDRETILEMIGYIESRDMLSALYVLTVNERELGKSYTADFVSGHNELFESILTLEDEEMVPALQTAYLCMMNLDAEACEKLWQKITAPVFDAEGKPDREKKIRLGRNFNAAVKGFKTQTFVGLVWQNCFCRNVMQLYAALQNDKSFLLFEGRELQHHEQTDIENDEYTKQFFDALYQYGDISSCLNLLKVVRVEDTMLRLSKKEFVYMLFATKDARLLAFGKWFYRVNIDPDYNYVSWLEDVLRYNEYPETVRWMQLTAFYLSLDDKVKNEQYEEFEKLLENAEQYEMFDRKITYVKQMASSILRIVNKLILDGKSSLAITFIRAIENINVLRFSSDNYDFFNNQLESNENVSDYIEIKERLFKECDAFDFVYLYLNSHLKYYINFEEVVLKSVEVRGYFDRYIFENYEFAGEISVGYQTSSAAEKIFITPKGVQTELIFTNYIRLCQGREGRHAEKAKELRKHLICNETSWYTYNKDYAQLMRNEYRCKYRIAKVENDRILATAITIDEKVAEERRRERSEIFPGQVEEWLDQMLEHCRFSEWDERKWIFGIRNIENEETRSRIAIKELKVIHTFFENDRIDDIKTFISRITNPPWEELNEFRYVPSQATLEFNFVGDDFRKIKYEIVNMANEMLTDSKLSKDIKMDIYLNTCIRKLYDLSLVFKYIGDALVNEPIVFSMQYGGVWDGYHHFSSKRRFSTTFSQRDFLYPADEEEFNPTKNYFVTLKEFNPALGSVMLDRVGLAKSQIDVWGKYLRILREMKKVTEVSGYDEIKEKFAGYRVNASGHLAQWVHEMNEVFRTQNFEIDRANTSLEVVGETNPFLHQKDITGYASFKEDFAARYTPSYNCFLECLKRHPEMAMPFCDFYFNSFLKVFISSEQFFKDIEADKNPGLQGYCMFKGYLPF